MLDNKFFWHKKFIYSLYILSAMTKLFNQKLKMKKLILLWAVTLATIWASYAMPNNYKTNLNSSATTGQIECLNNAKLALQKNLLSGQNFFDSQVKSLYEKKQNLLSWYNFSGYNFSWNIFSWKNLNFFKNDLLREDFHKFLTWSLVSGDSLKQNIKTIKKDFQSLKKDLLKSKLDFYKTYKADITACQKDIQKAKKLSKELEKNSQKDND